MMMRIRCMDERLRLEDGVQRLGRKDGRERLPGESQKGPRQEGGGVELKGRERTVALGRQIVAGGLTFWNLGALHGHTQERCPVLCTERVGIYMTHGGRGGTAEQRKAKMQKDLTRGI